MLCAGRLFFRHSLALPKADGLADTLAQVVKLGPASHTAALHLDLGNLWRMKRKLPLHPFAGHDPPHGEHFPAAAAGSGNHRAAEDLNSLVLTLEDARMHIDSVADCKLGRFGFE